MQSLADPEAGKRGGMACVVARAYNVGQPQRGKGHSPWSEDYGAKPSPFLKLKAFWQSC